MNRLQPLPILGVLIAATIVTSAALAKRAVEPERIQDAAALGALPGIVQAGDTTSVTAISALTIAELRAEIGDELGTGDAIARIDSSAGQLQLAQLELTLGRVSQEVVDLERSVAWLEEAIHRRVAGAVDAPSQLAMAERDAQQVPMRQARDSPARAELALEQAQLKLRRIEQLFAAGLIPRQEVDDARILVRLAADDLANAREAAAAAARITEAETGRVRAQRALFLADERRRLVEMQAALERKRFDLSAARLEYDAVKATTSDPFVRAAREGVVLELFVRTGDRLVAGAPIARLASLDPMFVDVGLRADVVNRVRIDDTAIVAIPAASIAGRQARIRSIAPLPADDGTYLVRLLLPNPARARLSGQTAYVRLVPDGTRPAEGH
jgi:multidrug resistance efflux pump